MALLHLLLLPLLLLPLPAAPIVATDGGPVVADIDGWCAWRICLVVTVERPPTGRRDDHGEEADARSLVMHRCHRSHDNPAQCYLVETASNLDGVRNFTMRRAELAAVPLADLCRYRRLSQLDLAENAVKEFAYPEGLPAGCLARLRRLNLRANALRQADLSQFMRLPGLEELDLSENPQLESLYMSQPPQSGVALKVIRAAKCRIKLVDISLIRLPSLQDLDLSFNRVTRITNQLNWNWTLEEVGKIAHQRNSRRAMDPHYYVRLSIQLVQNQIGSEAFDRYSLWGLPVKDLASSEPDKVLKDLRLYQNAFLPFLYIDNFGSTITCDCHLMHAWNYFRRVRWDSKEFIKRNALYLDYWMRLPCEPAGPSPIRLGKLTLSSLTAPDLTCHHVHDCPAGCTCLEQVSPSQLVVDCRGAGLSAMPARLPVSVHPVRYILLLADNRIRALRAPPNASLVQVLDLSGNRITEAADFSPLAAFAYLHSLNLTGNPMRRIPPSLLDLGQRSVRPSVDLGPSGVLCDCDLFKPDAWTRLRRLFPDLGNLHCLQADSAAGRLQPLAQLVEYGHRHCAMRVNTTSIVYKERHVFGQPIVLWVGVGLFLLTLVAAVLAILQFRRPPEAAAAGGRGKAAPAPLLPPPPPPPLTAGGCNAGGGENGAIFSFGCISPDYLPPGYSPYEMPSYVPTRGGGVDCADRRPATLVFLRSADAGGVAGGDPGGCGRGSSRTRALNCPSSSSSSSSSSDSSSSVAGEGSHNLAIPISCPRHPSHNSHGHSQGHSHRPGSRSRHPSRRSGGGCQQSMGRLLLERELLLPPPLPPRPTSSGLGAAGVMPPARVTDV